jgi:dephospho-CoA kinase
MIWSGAMKLIVVTGMPAAGKNIVDQYARMHGYPYFSTGDIVREEIHKRGSRGDAQTSAKISTELRGVDGLGVTRMAVDRVLKHKSQLVFIEGVRSWPEIELIRSKLPATLVAVVAPKEMRLARVKKRGREDDSVSYFDDRDRREIGYGVAVCIALADAYILNTGTVDEALEQVEKIVAGLA